jgi:2,5-diamino-6-(ribosylamino)-4(3H)-pyrimidinone 5'-phosphate reductase
MERPFVFINVAATADGKIDTAARHGATISSVRDKARVDRLRADSDAIMIGGRTLHGDDPKLTVKSEALRLERRGKGLSENPIKAAVATRLEIGLDCNFVSAGPARIMLFTTLQTRRDEIARLRSAGAEVHVLGESHVDLRAALQILKEQGVSRLMVEGGAALNFEMLRLNLVDELMIFTAPLIFGGDAAPTVAGGAGLAAEAAIGLDLISCEQWDDGGVVMNYAVHQVK